jgi:Polyketide cyclase / dehydrase and lipid transport
MARFTTTVPSRRSQADAFAYMAAFENAREWDPSVTEASRVGDEPLAVGTSFEVVSKFGPRLVPLTYTIVRYEPDRLVVLEARSKGFVSTDTITVEPAGDASTVTYDAMLSFNGLGRLADPLMQVVFNRVGRKAEARLREVL